MSKYIPYWEKLQDVRWQRKRLEILEAAGWMCDACQAGGDRGGATMHVHHSFYRKGVEPWDYPNNTYQALCASCHEEAESVKRDFEEHIFTLPPHVQKELFTSIFDFIVADGHPFSGIAKLAELIKEHIKQKNAGGPSGS